MCADDGEDYNYEKMNESSSKTTMLLKWKNVNNVYV